MLRFETRVAILLTMLAALGAGAASPLTQAAVPSAGSAGELAAAARGAKEGFTPRTAEDLNQARATLVGEMDALDARLQASGANGESWRKYLKVEELKQEFAQPTPDLAKLDAAYAQFAAGHEGLRLAVFADVRDVLRRYLSTARAIGNAKLREQYATVLETLAERLEAYQKTPSADNATAIATILAWLEDAGQAKDLVRTVHVRLSQPNLFLQVSGQLVASRIAGPVDDSSPVVDCILGTTIYATAHARGELTAELVPSSGQGMIDIIFRGNIEADSVGYNGPATIYSTGHTSLAARKRLIVTPQEITSLPAISEAQTQADIHSIDTNGRALIEKFAWKRAMKQKCQAEAIAADHAEQRFNERMDQQAETTIAQSNQQLLQRLRRPLAARRLLPESYQVSTTADALQIMATITGGQTIAAPTSPPPVVAKPDLVVRVHESTINNLTTNAVAGMMIDEERFQKLVGEFLGLPERIETAKDEENWAITFARQQPISVRFADGGFAVTIRGSAYTNEEGREYPGMNVTAEYKIEKTPRTYRAVRQGPLQIFPQGFVPGSGQQLSARQQAIRTVLQRRFGRFFEEELTPKNLVLGPDSPKPAELQMSQWESNGGWLVVAWQQVDHSKKAKAPAKP